MGTTFFSASSTPLSGSSLLMNSVLLNCCASFWASVGAEGGVEKRAGYGWGQTGEPSRVQGQEEGVQTPANAFSISPASPSVHFTCTFRYSSSMAARMEARHCKRGAGQGRHGWGVRKRQRRKAGFMYSSKCLQLWGAAFLLPAAPWPSR